MKTNQKTHLQYSVLIPGIKKNLYSPDPKAIILLFKLLHVH